MTSSPRSRRSSWFSAIATALAVAGSATTSGAANPPAADAEQLVTQGVQLRRQHQDEAALDVFRRAYEIDKSGRTLAQIALAEQALGRWLDAEKNLGEALRMQNDPWILRNRDALGEALADVSRHIGQLDLECNVSGAELFVDDRSAGALPLKALKLAAGKSTLEIRASGYAPTRFEIQVPGGATLREKVELSRLVSPVDPAPAAAGPSPFAMPLASPSARQEGSLQRTTALIMLGSGGLLLLSGAVAHVLREQALAKYNDNERCFYDGLTRDQRCSQDKHDADTAQTVMTLGYAVGGVAVAASVVLLVTLPGRRDSKTVVTLRPAPGGARLSYETSF